MKQTKNTTSFHWREWERAKILYFISMYSSISLTVSKRFSESWSVVLTQAESGVWRLENRNTELMLRMLALHSHSYTTYLGHSFSHDDDDEGHHPYYATQWWDCFPAGYPVGFILPGTMVQKCGKTGGVCSVNVWPSAFNQSENVNVW